MNTLLLNLLAAVLANPQLQDQAVAPVADFLRKTFPDAIDKDLGGFCQRLADHLNAPASSSTASS